MQYSSNNGYIEAKLLVYTLYKLSVSIKFSFLLFFLFIENLYCFILKKYTKPLTCLTYRSIRGFWFRCNKVGEFHTRSTVRYPSHAFFGCPSLLCCRNLTLLWSRENQWPGKGKKERWPPSFIIFRKVSRSWNAFVVFVIVVAPLGYFSRVGALVAVAVVAAVSFMVVVAAAVLVFFSVTDAVLLLLLLLLQATAVVLFCCCCCYCYCACVFLVTNTVLLLLLLLLLPLLLFYFAVAAAVASVASVVVAAAAAAFIITFNFAVVIAAAVAVNVVFSLSLCCC